MSPGKSKRITNALKQTAVYWGTPVSDGQGGRTFADPVELAVRWEQKQELFRNAAGQESTSSAIVFVGQDVDLGGYLYLGELTDISSGEEGNPQIVSGAYEIRLCDKTPDFKATNFVRRAWL